MVWVARIDASILHQVVLVEWNSKVEVSRQLPLERPLRLVVW